MDVNLKESQAASVQTISVVVVSLLLVAIFVAVIILCVMKKKKEKPEKGARLEDGEVHEELITSNNQNQTHAAPGMDSQLTHGIRDQPTRNPEHRKWYESKAIPFMDASVGSIPEATAGERV